MLLLMLRSLGRLSFMVTNVGLDTPYDTDDSGAISGTEVLNAVREYFAGDITGAEVLQVVRLYFAGL
jgi:hypothetical protein